MVLVDPLAKARVLEAEGALLPAARAYEAASAHEAAAAIFARLSLPLDEARCASAAGDGLRAHACLLSAGQWSAAARLRTQLLAEVAATEESALLQGLAEHCVARGRLVEGARLWELQGDLGLAAALHLKAGARLDAATILVAAGRSEEARDLLMRWEAESQSLGAEPLPLPAIFLLIRLLLLGPDPMQAARHAQAVLARVDRPEPRRAALAVLVAAFSRAGRPAAAEEALSRLRALHPEAPATPEAVLRSMALEGESTGSGAGEQWVLGRYRLDRLLGAGAAGQVYRALDSLTGQTVAVKILAPLSVEAGGESGSAADRFYREARVAQSIDDPGLVRVLDARPEAGVLVMEYLFGGTLAERLRGGRALPLPEVVRLGAEIARALAAAHRRGVLHRDVKPANILFDQVGAARLGDFGAAHLVSFQQTGTGYLLGTLAYLSPEQLAAAPLDGRSDLFALSVTLYRAATGRLPFPGPAIARQQAAGAPPPSRFGVALSPAVDAFFAQALAQDPVARFESGEALAAALQGLLVPGPSLSPEAGRGPACVRPSDDAGAPHEVATEARDTERFDLEVALGARVSLARDARLGRRVVVERLPDGVEAEALSRLREVAAAGNPHLQPLLDLIPEEGIAVYHLVEGGTLEELAREGCAPALARRICADLARAMIDHPGPLRPGRIRVVGGRGLLLLAGTIGSVAGGAGGPEDSPIDLRPAIGRVHAWLCEGEDPGPDPAVGLSKLAALGLSSRGEAPAGARELALWLDAGRGHR